MNSLNEEWRDVVGFEGFYQVSSLGRVRSLDRWILHSGKKRFKKGVVRAEKLDYHGYPSVALCLDGRRYDVNVHTLVARAFVDGYFEGAHVNHIDGVKANNIPSNLEFCTRSQNMKHAYSLGLKKPVSVASRRVLSDDDVRSIRSLLASGNTCVQIASRFGVKDEAIRRIKTGQTWSGLI